MNRSPAATSRAPSGVRHEIRGRLARRALETARAGRVRIATLHEVFDHIESLLAQHR